MRAVHALCDRVVVFDQGKVLASGLAGDVLSNAAVVSAYLGKRESPAGGFEGPGVDASPPVAV